MLAHVHRVTVPLTRAITETLTHHFSPVFVCSLPFLSDLMSYFVVHAGFLTKSISMISIIAGCRGTPFIVSLVTVGSALIVLFTVIGERKMAQR